MRMVDPISIDIGGALVSTNVGTSLDPAAWNIGTTYDKADRAVVGEVVYQSSVDSNVGNDPTLAGSTYWEAVQKINQLLMFDGRIGAQTVNAGSIVVVLAPGQATDTVSLRNISGALTAEVAMNDPADGLVYDESKDLMQPVVDWFDYHWGAIGLDSDALFSDLPAAYARATITVTLTGSGDVACGELLMGLGYEPGFAILGCSDGIDDYSQIKPDAWGVRDIVERDFADDTEMTVIVDESLSARFRQLLAARRAKPTLFIVATRRADSQVYGLPSFRRTFQLFGTDYFALTVKGMT